MLPLGFVGLWAARHGTFPPAAPVACRAAAARTPAFALVAPALIRWADGRRGARADLGRGTARSSAGPSRPTTSATPSGRKDVKHVAVLDRDDEGRGTRVEYRVAGLGRSIRYVLAYDYGDAPAAFSWQLRRRATVCAASTGGTASNPRDDGTRVTYDLVVDVAIPLPGLIKRRAAGMIMGTALRELKKEAEPMSEPLHDLHGDVEPETDPDPEPEAAAMTEPLRDVSSTTDRPDEREPTPGTESEAGPGLPPPSAIESLVSALLEAGPEVAEHVVRAAQELLLAAQCVVDAAGTAVREQQDVRRASDEGDGDAGEQTVGDDAPASRPRRVTTGVDSSVPPTIGVDLGGTNLRVARRGAHGRDPGRGARADGR